MMEFNKGTTRLVFIFKTFVVKIPNFTYSWLHFITGIMSNIKEKQAWDYSKYNDTQHLLCPIIWCSWGGWLLLMKKVDVLREHIDYTPWIVAGYDGDNKPNNFGYYKNKIVKIDYGQ